MSDKFLYEKLEVLKEVGELRSIPDCIERGLSKKIDLREYQKEAFANFVTYFEKNELNKGKQIHTLFHMATGSGKTVIMAGLILYLYSKGYRKFLFFVNQTNVLEKTIENFINPLSSKYLFNEDIEMQGNKIKVNKVDCFSENELSTDIEIIFTTTQKLHMDLQQTKENSITYEDFEMENNRIVFISDESHHINSSTKRLNKEEELEKTSWENTVTNAFTSNSKNIMLEFTATCDLKNENVREKYLNKIIFNYPLALFRESGYTKDFKNFATDTTIWKRVLMALVVSEYRRYLFADLKLNIKPVILLKSQTVKESESFYEEFFKNMKKVNNDDLLALESVEIDILNEAFSYFKTKDSKLELLEKSIKDSFGIENSIILNSTKQNTRDNQLLVNSLEEEKNPIRIIFTVDMLNEGWDVLNLFDIVRLYETRQSSGKKGKIGSYTIKEAQLIGRGARYCPFVIDDEDLKFKRKYDNNLDNKNRVLETMYFHSKNDSRYISELRTALIETGMQSKEETIIEYKLKDKFKETDFYKNTLVFSNKRVLKSRDNIREINSDLKKKVYRYKALSEKGKVNTLFGNNGNKDDITTEETETKYKELEFKDIDLNILLGALDCFSELRFNILKSKYPILKSKKEFLTSNNFLGNLKVSIEYYEDELKGKDIYLAVKNALENVASYINSLKQEYIGSKDFVPHQLKQVLKDKKLYLSNVSNNGGKGNSQNNSDNDEYRINLLKEDWYVYNDNYGTSEEKSFIKYFKTNIEPKLKERNLEYYLVRNERISELAIYSFDKGERFEPDFLLFVKKKNDNNTHTTYQGYIEPKGDNLLKEDKWKENFLSQIMDNGNVKCLSSNEYRIFGLPFYNQDNRRNEFEESINFFLNELN